MTVTIFQPLFTSFDNTVLATINTGSANMISLISPLMAAGFSVYITLIMLSYWRGGMDNPIHDFMMKMVAWAVILTAGMNIGYYSEYVVPFFDGIGDDIATALTGQTSMAVALDTLLNAYLSVITTMYEAVSPFQVGLMIETTALATVIILVALPFLAIAAAYIILAKFALGLLLALGPMFVSAALFPATRKFFDAWAGQCLNYGLLTALFAAAGAIEVQFATSMVPTGSTLSDMGNLLAAECQLALMGIVFILISLNLPSLASQLAGGIGISSMVGKLSGVGALARQAMKGGSNGGGSPESGGDIAHSPGVGKLESMGI